MQTIKKYANRKLYHINRKQYITLDGIATLIQAGEQVQVVDNESGEDITAPILAQVVAQARGRTGRLPTQMLTELIQAGGETIAEMRRSVWDRLGGAALVDAEIARRLEQLQAEGAIGAEETERLRRLLLRTAPETAPAPLFDVPSHYDLTQLKTQVDALTRTVEQLLAAQTDREPHGEPR